MANDDSQSISGVLLVDDYPFQSNSAFNPPASPPTSKPPANNGKWTLRAGLSTVSFRRYRSSFRRGAMNTLSVNSHYSMAPSFPLFRRFYLTRSSSKRRRTHGLSDTLTDSFSLSPGEKLRASPRIGTSHVLTTIVIILVSACLLVFMILLDLAYLDDAIINSASNPTISSSTRIRITTLCVRRSKVCMMKGLVLLVFAGITITLCYSILALYTRAQRHSRLLERKTNELEKEKCLTEKLLHEILPPCVAKDLINGRKAPAEYYESVTVYFSDIVGFTIIARYGQRVCVVRPRHSLRYSSSMCSPNETCDMLNRLYSIFDSLLENFDVYKVETIGDAYMVVSGAPNRNGDKVSRQRGYAFFFRRHRRRNSTLY